MSTTWEYHRSVKEIRRCQDFNLSHYCYQTTITQSYELWWTWSRRLNFLKKKYYRRLGNEGHPFSNQQHRITIYNLPKYEFVSGIKVLSRCQTARISHRLTSTIPTTEWHNSYQSHHYMRSHWQNGDIFTTNEITTITTPCSEHFIIELMK